MSKSNTFSVLNQVGMVCVWLKHHKTPQLIGDLSCEKTDKKFLFDQMIFDEQEN